MKKLFFIILCAVAYNSNAQEGWHSLTFDASDTFYHNLIVIDTTNYHHNIWQVGKPAKTTFTSALSPQNVLVTDTLNPYPVNDTSVFILKVPGSSLCWLSGTNTPLFMLQFFYQLNIDSNTIARVEIAADTGINTHWVNVKDSLPVNFTWWSGGAPPNLDSSTSGWTQFGLAVNTWPSWPYDTVLMRFTFISDSVFAGKDGWMIDNFSFMYWCEGGVPQVQNDNLISIYPNPSVGEIYITSAKQQLLTGSVSIYNMLGQELYKNNKVPQSGYLRTGLPRGIYVLKYFTDNEYCVKRIIIDR